MGGRHSAARERDNNNDLFSVCIESDLFIFSCLFFYFQFAQLINTHRKLGAEKFPLIEQTFYPNYKEMVRTCDVPLSAASKDNFRIDQKHWQMMMKGNECFKKPEAIQAIQLYENVSNMKEFI